jgi:hypothetical protein
LWLLNDPGPHPRRLVDSVLDVLEQPHGEVAGEGEALATVTIGRLAMQDFTKSVVALASASCA